MQKPGSDQLDSGYTFPQHRNTIESKLAKQQEKCKVQNKRSNKQQKEVADPLTNVGGL
jgi:hypothetical protein